MKYCTVLQTKDQRHVQGVKASCADFNALNAMYVSKESQNTYIHTFLLITLLIFSQFLIPIKF